MWFEPITLFLHLFFDGNVFWADSSLSEGSQVLEGLVFSSDTALLGSVLASGLLCTAPASFKNWTLFQSSQFIQAKSPARTLRKNQVAVHKAPEVTSGEDPGLNSATLHQPSLSFRQPDPGHTSTPANLNFPFYMEWISKYLLSHRKQTVNY